MKTRATKSEVWLPVLLTLINRGGSAHVSGKSLGQSSSKSWIEKLGTKRLSEALKEV